MPESSEISERVSPKFIRNGAVVLAAVCLLPELLALLGISFASADASGVQTAIDMATQADLEPIFHAMGGSYTHTILEVCASVVALLTVVLAFTHFAIRRDVVTPVIAIALFWSGAMDGFHTLAADRLIEGSAGARDLIPFTWSICRTFNAIIPVTVLGMLIVMRRYDKDSSMRKRLGLVTGAGIGLGVLAYMVIHFCATSDSLPQTMYPDSIITRPFDVLPLGIYFISGLFIYPKFFSRTQSYFAVSLWLSVIPDFATQMYMSFGSTALFDHNFNVAHVLKIVAYLVPTLGLLADYVHTYRRVEKEVETRIAAEKQVADYALEIEFANIELSTFSRTLEAKADALMKTNEQLDEFCYVASHDLREPLRGIHNYATFLLEDYGDRLDEDGKRKLEALPKLSKRLDTFIDSLLEYSRVGRVDDSMEEVNMVTLVEEVGEMLASRIEEMGAELRVADDLPNVYGVPTGIEQIISNLISNALKYNNSESPLIEVGWEPGELGPIYFVKDNGIGIREKHQESIFQIFKRLHGREKFGGGAGAGLTIVRKIVHSHGGEISVESEIGCGATFRFHFGFGENS